MKIYKIFIFLTVIITVYIINANTPLMWEDIIYTLKADKTLATTMNTYFYGVSQLIGYENVYSIKDICISQYYHYNYANGRVLAHFSSQMFGGLVGKSVFNVFNVLALLLFGKIVTLCTVGKSKFLFYYWCLAMFSLWYFMHQTNTCFFLMTYALNYLWSSVFCLTFLYMYIYKMYVINKKWKLWLFCVFSFGAGWSHEGVVVGIAGAIFIDCLIKWRRKRLDYRRMLPAMCFCLGALFLCLAPGNFNRVEAALPLYNHLLSFARLRIFYVMAVVFLLFSRSFRFILSNRVIISALIIQMVFMFYVAYLYIILVKQYILIIS